MPRMGHANPRTYGAKLHGKTGEKQDTFPVTTRMCDAEHFNRTGEVKYLDEEGETMPKLDQKELAKKFKAEITVLEQFLEIGSYSQVASKYGVSKSTAHGHMVSLRVKKAREEKEMLGDKTISDCPKEGKEEEAQKPTTKPLIGCFGTYENEICEATSCGKIEECKIVAEGPIDTPLGKISPETGRYICADCGEGIVDAVGVYAQSGLCSGCSKELNKHVEDMENQWTGVKQVRSIEEIRQSIESDIAVLHRMIIAQAERDFQGWLAGVVEEC